MSSPPSTCPAATHTPERQHISAAPPVGTFLAGRKGENIPLMYPHSARGANLDTAPRDPFGSVVAFGSESSD